MIYIYLQLLITALVSAAACALPGTFLVLRGTSFMSDALGHAILLGIVLSFFVLQTLHSPLMFIGATLIGLATVACIELLIATRRIHQDAAIGIVYPLLFSIAVLLINLFASSIHLDSDAVLLGELAFTPLQQFKIQGIDCGSCAIWIMSTILIFNFFLIAANFKAFKIVIFDADFATLLNFKSPWIHYLIMAMTCITIVGAFECAGAILVVAFMIIPPATAYLITNRLTHMLAVSVMMAMIGAVSGCIMAHLCNVSIAGSIATMNGIWFFVILILSKKCKQFMVPRAY
jgi:manganese/zinc/iron transport system permease protein